MAEGSVAEGRILEGAPFDFGGRGESYARGSKAACAQGDFG
jgi:hypothetical protein